MKKAAMMALLSLLLVSSVFAAIQDERFVGSVSSSDYDNVMCEKEKRNGVRSGYSEKLCCINKDNTQFCDNNEPIVGTCYNGFCTFPTKTFYPWHSWRYKTPPCARGFMAGKEYDELFKWADCEKNGVYWCCGAEDFPVKQGLPLITPAYGFGKPFVPTTNGSLLILTDVKWQLMERKGYYLTQRFEAKAFASEKQRCANGGGDIRIIDQKYGSFFKDSKNLKPGMRVFYFEGDKMTPLVTWCDKK